MRSRSLSLTALSLLFVAGATNHTTLAQLTSPVPNLTHVIPRGIPKDDQEQFRVMRSLRDIAAGCNSRSNADAGFRRAPADGLAGLARGQEERGLRVRPESTQNTIPYWSDSFTYQGLEFKYKMVGTDPKNGSRTTVIPTVIIPLRFVFPDGQVFDASTDIVDGQTAIQGIINSPVFQNYDFVSGGTHVGNTQYGDAFQRANFWDSVSTKAKDYHVLLGQPTVLPLQTINVPADKGSYFRDPLTWQTVPVVDYAYLASQTSPVLTAASALPTSLPIMLWGRVVNNVNSGFHGSITIGGSGVQTYIGTSYWPPDLHNTSGGTNPDVWIFSHEIAEWMDDPFSDNYTPGWNIPFITPDERCDNGSIARGLLETADPVESFQPDSIITLPSPTFSYHVTEAMFIDFYTRAPHSRSVNGQYSFFEIGRPYGLPTMPSSECVGSVQADEHYIDVPGSVLTSAQGVNNKGDVVGYYLDQQSRTRGFIWKNGSFGAVEVPGALGTIASKINDSGDIVGYFADSAGVVHGFSYINRGWARIDFPGSADTIALGINSTGDIVGAYDLTQPVTHGFILRNGHFRKVDTPFAQQAQLTGINDGGSFAGSTWNDGINGPFFGFISENGRFSILNMPSAQFTFAEVLDNNGTIAGNFENVDNGSVVYASGFVRLFGYLHEVNSNGVQTFVFGNNDRDQIVGQAFDVNTRRLVGYIGELPLRRDN